jgi:hypothetical protein
MKPQYIVFSIIGSILFVGIMVGIGYLSTMPQSTNSESQSGTSSEMTADEQMSVEWSKRCPEGAPLLYGDSFLKEHPECRGYYQFQAQP